MTALFEDKFAIQELIVRYSHTIDSRDYEGWLACFAEDGAFEASRGRWAGQAQLREFTKEYESRRDRDYPGLRHHVNNVLIDVQGNTARSSSYLQVGITDDQGARFAWCGRYEDTFVKVGGAWRFKERKVLRDERPA